MKKGRGKFIVTLMLALFMAATFMACSSTNAVEKSKNMQEVTAQKEVESTSETMVEPTAEATSEPAVESTVEATSEPTVEVTPEPAVKAIVYEGIDMESTLPGMEWIETFKGVIDEPKFVVYNDATNRKVIVENGGEVEIFEGDILAIYAPVGTNVRYVSGIVLKELSSYNNYYTECVIDMYYFVSREEVIATLESKEGDIVISCGAVPK